MMGNVWRRLVQTARLCCGVPDYENYVRHLRLKHPDRPVPDYASFFRERQNARYRGSSGGRCC
ncbi:MAG: CstA-like transporter-associated (seleno)protein [Woeseia sp.]